MNPILTKLRYKGQDPILIANMPQEHKIVIEQITTKIHITPKNKYDFIQLFARTKEELEANIKLIMEALKDDGYLWLCYPKGTSKKYRSDLNRDKIREIAGKYNFEGVSQIAIDDDWSALRVRDVDYIKNMKRKAAMSGKGKAKIEKGRTISGFSESLKDY